MRRAILILGLLGAGVFAGAFFLSFAKPLLVERAARELVRMEVQQQVAGQLDVLSDSRIAKLAQRALRRTDTDIEQTQEAIRDDLAGKVAAVVADMLNPDCACRQRLASYAPGAKDGRLSSQLQVRERLSGLIESSYASVAQSLLREFRIFTGSNGTAFALLALVAWVRNAKLQLLLPALALIGAVLLTGGLYLFNQDWLHTIVFGDYLGLGYAAWLSGVALLLADILMNHARVTTHMVNFALNALGAVASAAPC